MPVEAAQPPPPPITRPPVARRKRDSPAPAVESPNSPKVRLSTPSTVRRFDRPPAAAGDRLQLQGPGGAYAPDPDASAYLMVGDPSVMPAIAASLERVPAGRSVDVVLQVPDAEDRVEFTTPGDLRLHWLHDRGDEVLTEAVRELDLPDNTDAFVHGEASSVRALRRHLIVERGIPRDALSVSGYWKRSRTEEGWREDKTEWNRLVQTDEDQAA
jgi:NAD(P)H-flavin reductase